MRYLYFPFAAVFYFFVSLRNLFYALGFFKKYKLPLPVISIGNLTMGGTGKTPITEALIEIYKNKGLKAAILSRGYGRAEKKIMVVEVNSRVQDVGDEPLWIKTKQPEAEVVVGANRFEAFKKVSSAVQVVILDDGFQHQRILRDKNIVLIDATANFSDYCLFPIGRAREPMSSLARCDAVFITKVNFVDNKKIDFLKRKLEKYEIKKIFEIPFYFDGCVDIKNQQKIIDIKNKSVLLFSAIANPTAFKNFISQEGANIVGTQDFKDHYFYKQKDIEGILLGAKEKNADLILTTEKDAMKLSKLNLSYNIGIVKLKVQISDEVINWLGL